MPSDTAWRADDEPDPRLRPAWEDTPDETDADLGRGRHRPASARADQAGAWPAEADLRALLAPLSLATDALARLDARAAAADDAVRQGLIARMAYAEAAGWLAHSHAWVHPLDLSLRELGLTASTALAAVGRGHRSLPQTFAGTADLRAWADPPFDTLADGDRAVAEALALARMLRRLAGQSSATGFASATAAQASLQALGAGRLDGAAFAAWWDSVAPQPQARRRTGVRAEEGATPPLPSLLTAAHAAQSFMESTIAETPTPAQALLLAAGLLARAGAVRTVVLPVWTAYPAAGFGERDALPTLRSDAADRLVSRGRPVTWPLAFLHLVAESARAGLRALDRLEEAGEQGRGLAAASDRRSRLADAIDALLRAPALTPKALAAKLKVAPQTGTALLRELQAKGLAREVTGRGSFRAFAI
jgi:HTH DNA binding domain